MDAIKERLSVARGDITRIKADAIVNAANSTLLGGGGVDGAIHRVGGPVILEECKKIAAAQGGCETGKAVATIAGSLPAKFVIHTVGPVWSGGGKNEREKLADCYRNSLGLAVEKNCRSISFPCISTGVFRFPVEEAAKIAVSTVVAFLKTNETIGKVIFVCFDDINFLHINRLINAQE